MDELAARIAFNAPLVPTIRRIRHLKGPEDLDDSVRNFAVAEEDDQLADFQSHRRADDKRKR